MPPPPRLPAVRLVVAPRSPAGARAGPLVRGAPRSSARKSRPRSAYTSATTARLPAWSRIVGLRDPLMMTARLERDRARGALLGTFVGDALGMPFEGAQPAEVPARLVMLDARLGRGTYTDDTQMAIALAESLLERGEVDAAALGRAFAGAHDPRRGYGAGTTEVLRLIRSGIHPHAAASTLFGGQG